MQTATADVEDVKQAETTEVIAEKEPQPAEEVKEAKPEKSAEQRRIDRLTRDKHQFRGEIAELRRQIDAMRQPQPTEGAEESPKEAFERMWQERKEEERAEQHYEKSLKVFRDAVATSDIDERDFIPLGDIPVVADGILECDNPAQVYLYFQKNPSEIERLSEMSPSRQLVELGKIEDKLKQKPALKKSAAPEPIKPISGKAPAEGLHDELSSDDWMRERNKQIQNR